MTIIANKTRNDVCGCSTGSVNTFYNTGRTEYYDWKGQAVNSVDAVLQGHNLCIDRDELGEANRFGGDAGRETFTIRDDRNGCAGTLVCVYYRMSSGKYEFIFYIA